MNRNLKKVWPALAISLVLATSCVNAADNADMTRSKSNADMQRNMPQQQKGSMGMITPPVNPVVQGADFSFGVEALYMRVTQDALFEGVANNDFAYPASDNFVNQPYDWSWGARANAGYVLPHDGWDLAAQWTWFHSSNTDNRVGSATGTTYLHEVDNTSIPVASPALVESMGNSSKVSFLMNIANVDLGREFFISKWLTLRPSIGGRGVWINTHQSITTVDILTPAAGMDPLTTQVKLKAKSSYNAGGIFGGLSTQWGFGDGWSLYGMITESIMYGTNSWLAQQIDNLGGFQYTENSISNKWMATRLITDLAIGLRWDYMFDNDNYRLRLQAGWEEHIFTNLTGNVTGNVGDLALTGASFKASFDF